FIADTRLTNSVNTLNGHLQRARSEAIKRGQRVNVCKSPDGLRCDNSAAWDEGWITFVDRNHDRKRNQSEPLIQRQQPLQGDIRLAFGSFYSSNYVVYYPAGRSPGNGTFTFCDSRGADHARALIFYKGRLRSATKKPDGTPLDCP
ncbi:MAG: GspH/FimT family protein, partial [Pseudomonadota bacterium]